MPPTGAVQRHAVASLRQLLPTSTLLPFLYCTRTIRCQHALAATADAAQDAHVPIRKNAAKRRDKRIRAANLGDGSNAGPELEALHSRDGADRDTGRNLEVQEKLPVRGQYLRNATHQRREPYTRSKAGEASQDKHLPFEGVEDEAVEEQVKKDILEGTTVTGKERKAFEKLLQLGYGARQARAKATEKDGETGIGPAHATRRGYEESQRRDMPAELQPLVDEHWARSTEENKELSPLQQAVGSDVTRVRNCMREAKSDVGLWRILHEEVIARVAALRLDSDSSSDPDTPSNPQPAQTKTEDTFPDREILMHSLQSHFRNFHHLSSRLFPASPLPLSLLPRLKALGPASFAFAASTYVYNKHLSALYRKNLDLSAFVATLEEMEHEVYEFDNKTYDVLRHVLARANFVKQGRAGDGVTTLWGSERIKNNIGKIYLWSKKVRERLKEKALEEARAKEAEQREAGEADELEAVAA